MNVISKMPVWVTVDEAVNIINSHKKNEQEINASDLYRYALYGNLKLSIYFQSPVKLRKVTISNNTAEYTKVNDDIIERLGYLCHHCFISNDNSILKTEGNYISPPHNILDASLHGHEYAILQKLLAHSLCLPEPVTGLYNVHHGVLVKDEEHTYQVYELTSWQNRISQTLKKLPIDVAIPLHDDINISNTLKTNMEYFPVYQFPDDACFVIKSSILEQFIDTFFPQQPLHSQKVSPRISTPLARLLWLACKHNQDISPLIEQPYKLISIFEEWAKSDGITERLNSETLKNALKRGSPDALSTSR